MLDAITATELTRRFTARELSPVEVLRSLEERIDRFEPGLNALTEQLREEALAAARESERRFAEGTQRPLEGIPVALKDEHPIAGRLQQDGSLLGRGSRAEMTHPIVDRILAAGAVIHARTTTPEYCAAPVTHSKLWGVSRNPHNPALSPGGSSGGSGAALAAGMTVLATGSDIAGSIRIPSAFCGTVGFKPPFGRVPGMAPFSSDTYCADGSMARSVADVARLQNVIGGPWVGDQASLRPVLQVAADPASLVGTRIALSLTLGDFDPDPEIIANTLSVAEALRAAGATVEEVSLPWTTERIIDLLWSHFSGIMGSSMTSLVDGDDRRAALLMPYSRSFIEGVSQTKLSQLEGLVGETAFSLPFNELLESYDALLCPTMATIGFEAEAACADSKPMLEVMMTTPFNVIGRVPVLALPSGRARNGLPTGVQLVGRTYDDLTVFRIGAAIERELDLWTQSAWWPGIQE